MGNVWATLRIMLIVYLYFYIENEKIRAINGKLAINDEVDEIINKTSIENLRVLPRLILRDKKILLLLKQGKSTQEIAEALFLSFLTIQTHRRNLLSKFQVKNVV